MYSLPPLSGRLILKLRLKLELWPEPRLILSSFLPPPSLRSPPTNKPVRWRHLPLFCRVNIEGWDSHPSTLHPLFLIHTAWDWDWYRERDLHNREQMSPAPCSCLRIVWTSLHSTKLPIWSCTSPCPGPMQCEYTKLLFRKNLSVLRPRTQWVRRGGGALWRQRCWCKQYKYVTGCLCKQQCNLYLRKT